MLNFNEDLLQFIWQQRLFLPIPITTVSGQLVTILNPGQLNTNAGPDFSNAQIIVGGVSLIGNVEIHVRSSDWNKHGHQSDPAYDTIILHAVYEHDCEIDQNSQHGVEIVELKHFIHNQTLINYQNFKQSSTTLPCANQLKHVADIQFLSWVDRMGVERLEKKVNRVEELHTFVRGDVAQLFYILLMRAFGGNVNALPFELLAKQLPLHLLLKHADKQEQLEALLLGVAGMLNEQFRDAYMRQLQNEYVFLARKYGLPELSPHIFKNSRMRPANFPLVRLVQMAQLILKSREFILAPQLFLKFDEVLQILTLPLNGYWKFRFSPDTEPTKSTITFGRLAQENVVINALVPFLFYCGKRFVKPLYQEKALELISACNFENNVKTRVFDAKRQCLTNALQSQGLLHLHDNYCKMRACLACGIGSALLRQTDVPKHENKKEKCLAPALMPVIH